MGSPSALRKLNDRAALYALVDSGPLSRQDLELAINVSRPAAAELLRRLEESGLARHAGERPGSRGPHAQLWSINEQAAYAAGLDVTDSGIDAVIADLGGHALGEARIEMDRGTEPMQAVKKVLGTAARRAGIRRSDVRCVVVGISGSVDPETGEVSHGDHIPEWLGFDVQGALSKLLETPVTVENDVKLVLRDESIRGHAVGLGDVMLLWMSQGIAIAVIADGRLQRGFRGSSGELGYVPVESGGATAGEILSTGGVLALAAEHGIEETDVVVLLERARLRAAESPDHNRFLDAFADRVAGVLASPVALMDPELIILGGDIGTAGGDELADRVMQRIHALLAHRPRVVAGAGYDKSVRQGALDEALRRLREDVFEDAREHREVAAQLH